jgi:hypothetical protein
MTTPVLSDSIGVRPNDARERLTAAKSNRDIRRDKALLHH